MELRTPIVYNSILEAVSNGRNRVVEISDHIHEEKSKCSKYILTLQSIRLHIIGKWWGNNPTIKAQDDVDILAFDKKKEKAIFCECKFRNKPMQMKEYDDLVTATDILPHLVEKHMMFISKSGFTEPVQRRAMEDGTRLLTLEDLMKI